MKCKYCSKDSEVVCGYWWSDGGSAEEEGDFICQFCFIPKGSYIKKSLLKSFLGTKINNHKDYLDVGTLMQMMDWISQYKPRRKE